MKNTLILSHYLCALLGLAASGMGAVFIAAFALDSPSAGDVTGLLVGGVTFALLSAPLVALPILAARRLQNGTPTVLPLVFGLVMVFVFFPLGLAMVAMAWGLRHTDQACAPDATPAHDGTGMTADGALAAPEQPRSRLVRLATGWGAVALALFATAGGLSMTFMIGGAMLMNGNPNPPPTPWSLYPGLALAALAIPMVVSLVLKMIGRGPQVVAVVQSLLLSANAAFWVVLLLELFTDFP